MRRLCPALPPPVSVAAGVVALLGCAAVLAVFAASRSVRADCSAHICASYALANALCLLVWLIPELIVSSDAPDAAGATCAAQAFLHQFSSLAALLWADAFALNLYLAVCRGHRILWRYCALYHIIGWGLPLLSALGLLFSSDPCWAAAERSELRALLHHMPLVLSLALLLALFIPAMRAAAARQQQRAPELREAVAAKMTLLGAFVALFALLRVPGVILSSLSMGPLSIRPLSIRPSSTAPLSTPPLSTGSLASEHCDGGALAGVGLLRAATDLGAILSALLPLLLFLSLGSVVKQLRVLIHTAKCFGHRISHMSTFQVCATHLSQHFSLTPLTDPLTDPL